jgi:hypothetical protein
MRKRMVRWLSPRALFITAVDVVISGIFGRYSDKRELEGALPGADAFPIEGDPLWIDYIADVGDGWNSTYTMAWLLAQDPERLDPPGRALKGTERGSVLIFGGDEVYPRASADEYQARLIGPYEAAGVGSDADDRTVFAIPGNHDWYDGLTSFMRIFCRNRRFAGRRAPQRRSYIALQLPHGWWLLGIDIAFDYYLDEAQLGYFRGLRCQNSTHPSEGCEGRMHTGDKIILCTGKPAWEEARLSGDFRSIKRTLGRQALAELEREIVRAPGGREEGWGCKLRLVLSGDLHHYMRYVSDDPTQPQRITAGGGGAYLYPTHVTASAVSWPSETQSGPATTYERVAAFPDPKTSRRSRWRIPPAPILGNPSFALLVGVLFLILGLVTPGSIHHASGQTSLFGSAGFSTFARLWMPPNARPTFVILGLLVLLGLYAFADAKTKLGAFVLMALPHWITQMYALTVTLSVGETLAWRWLPGSEAASGGRHLPYVFAAAGVIVVVGGLLGGVAMGMYLLLAQLLDRHPNEAFAAMHMTGYKNFLRLHLDRDGLTVYPFGIRRVCTRWRETSADGSTAELDPTACPQVELIEPPFVIASDP